MAVNWKFYGIVFLVVAAFGFVYLNSSSLSSDDFSAKAILGRGQIACTVKSGRTVGNSFYVQCVGVCRSSGLDCCVASGGKPGGASAEHEGTSCTVGSDTGSCSGQSCVYRSNIYSPSPSPTPRGPLVTARPSVIVRTSATPTPTPRATVAAGTPRPLTG